MLNTSNTRAGGLPWVRRTPSPYPVQLHVSSIIPDIRSRSLTPARPSPQRHIAGSLFATYTNSASCFLRTPCFQMCPCLVGVVLPSGNGGTTLCFHKGTVSASCQAHVKDPAAETAGRQRQKGNSQFSWQAFRLKDATYIGSCGKDRRVYHLSMNFVTYSGAKTSLLIDADRFV